MLTHTLALSMVMTVDRGKMIALPMYLLLLLLLVLLLLVPLRLKSFYRDNFETQSFKSLPLGKTKVVKSVKK